VCVRVGVSVCNWKFENICKCSCVCERVCVYARIYVCAWVRMCVHWFEECCTHLAIDLCVEVEATQHGKPMEIEGRYKEESIEEKENNSGKGSRSNSKKRRSAIRRNHKT
jgi:hypothetical protein